jgi:hypothetical protein
LPTGILIVTGFNSCLVVSSLAEDDTAVGGAAAFKDVTGDGAAAGVGAALVFLLFFETTPTLFVLPSDLIPSSLHSATRMGVEVVAPPRGCACVMREEENLEGSHLDASSI